MGRPKKLAYFLSRGFTFDTIKRQMWGWDGKNYVITVWADKPRQSDVVCLRLRSGDENSERRYSGITGYNEQMLYNREAMTYAIANQIQVLFIFYGELDAQLAWQDGLPAVSPTNGAKAVLPEWFSEYKGNLIFVPDLLEDRAAYEDAGEFGARGWVARIPHAIKDYSLFRQKYLPKEFLKFLPHYVRDYSIPFLAQD